MQEKIIKKFEIKNLDELNDTLGYFEADLAVYGNIDFSNDIIDKGAFGNIDPQKKFPLLADHDTRTVIGHFLADSMSQDALKIKGYFNFSRDPETKSLLVPKAGEKYANLKSGDISGFSVGFLYEKCSCTVEEIDGMEVRRMTKSLELKEGSVVTFPMNEKATLNNIKADDTKDFINNNDKIMIQELNDTNKEAQTKSKSLDEIKSVKNIEDIEDILKDYGFSCKGAKIIISKVKSFKESEPRDEVQAKDKDEGKRDANLKSLSSSISTLEKELVLKELETKLEKITNLIK
mgnify:CR=1 FL=1|tara:strand:- start:42351 stop:43223 length:873 start_codon:yes stop_codon:yes gene_type:complete